MNNLVNFGVVCALACALPCAPAGAKDEAGRGKAANIKVEMPWARATPGGAKVGAGYVTLTNLAAKPDVLIAVDSAIAGRIAVHATTMEAGVMRMRGLAGGLDLPPGKTVALKPGGDHLMLMDLKQPIVQGKAFMATLTFQNAGKVAVEFVVAGIGAMTPMAVTGSRTKGCCTQAPRNDKSFTSDKTHLSGGAAAARGK